MSDGACPECAETRQQLRGVSEQNAELAELVSALTSAEHKHVLEIRALKRRLNEERKQEPTAKMVHSLLTYWQEVHAKQRSNIEAGGDRWERMRKWLKLYQPQEIEDAISGIRWSDFHMGFSADKRKHVEVENILNPRQSLFERFRDDGRRAREQGLEPPDFGAAEREREERKAQRQRAQSQAFQRERKAWAEELPSDVEIQAMVQRLQEQPKLLARIAEVKGWRREMLATLNVGWDGERFTFPSYDSSDTLSCVARYLPGGAPKMIATRGRQRELFPAPESIEGDEVWIVEGEPDAVSAHTIGLPAVGVPGAMKWHDDWAPRLAFQRVFICFDCDEPGRAAAARIATTLLDAPGMGKVRVVNLERSRSDGFDLSDFVLAGGTAEQLRSLAGGAMERLRGAA